MATAEALARQRRVLTLFEQALDQRASDRDRLLPDLDGRRVADGGRRKAARPLDLDDGEVGEGVDAVDGGRKGAAVLEVHTELRGVAGDDVVVGHDIPAPIDEYTAPIPLTKADRFSAGENGQRLFEAASFSLVMETTHR